MTKSTMRTAALTCFRAGRPRASLLGLVLLGAFAGEGRGYAQQSSLTPPTEYQGVHQSQFGHFSHWSAAIQRGPQLLVEYAVCNLDDARLNYTWNGPNIWAGRGGALAVGKCHIVNRPVAALERDDRAAITFSQAGRTHGAVAHVQTSAASGALKVLPAFLEHRVRAFFDGGLKDPTVADLVLVQRRSNDGISHTITWYPPSVALAIHESTFGDGIKDAVIQIRKAGYAVETVTTESLMKGVGSVPPGIDAVGGSILISKTAESAAQLAFTLGGAPKGLGRSHLNIVAAERREVILGLETTVFAR